MHGWQEAVMERTFAAVVLDWGVAVVPDRRASLRAVRRRGEALCADGVHIAVVTDTPDSMRDILAVLARAGIGPGLVLAVGGKPVPPDAADGSGSLLRVRQAATVSGGDHPAGAFADISCGRGTARGPLPA